jgi:hypothetical protein
MLRTFAKNIILKSQWQCQFFWIRVYLCFAFMSYSRLWNKHSLLNNRSPPSQKFSHHIFNTFLHQSRHCGHFLFHFFFKFFQKLISIALCLFRSLEYALSRYLFEHSCYDHIIRICSPIHMKCLMKKLINKNNKNSSKTNWPHCEMR